GALGARALGKRGARLRTWPGRRADLTTHRCGFWGRFARKRSRRGLSPQHWLHAPATVNSELGPGDEPGGIGTQEQHRVDEILRGSDAPDGGQRGDSLFWDPKRRPSGECHL